MSELAALGHAAIMLLGAGGVGIMWAARSPAAAAVFAIVWMVVSAAGALWAKYRKG